MRLPFYFLRFLRAEEGNVFIMVAVAAMMIIISTGAAVDMARAQILQTKIQSALDAAGLAAGAVATTAPSPLPGFCGSSTWVQCEAQKYFDANFPAGYLASGAVTVTATRGGTNNELITLTATTTQATTFMKVVGINSVNVGANSQITLSTSGMELVLVLDNTGSMSSAVNPANSSISKIAALKSALVDSGGLLDILYGSNTTIPNFWIGVVPFTYTVNIGSSHSAWMDTSYDSTLDYGPTVTSTCPSYSGTNGTHYNGPSRCSYTMSLTNIPFFGMTNWGGCVLARISPHEESDQGPSASVSGSFYKAFYYASDAANINNNKCTGGSNSWMCSKTSGTGGSQTTQTIYEATTTTTGPNLNCIATPVLGMTATKNNVVNEVNAMVAGGSTMINLGMGWGYRMLSPNWQGLWGGEMNNTGNTQFPQLPLSYHTALMNKVVILMTDGINSPPSSSIGSAYQGQSLPTVTDLDNRTKTVCDAMKANGIIIYAIGFGTTDDNDASNPTSVNGPLLKYCATQNYAGDTSHYFLAPTNAALSGAFSQIGAALANLRISQ